MQARRSEFSESGYASGVVRCFSSRQPSTRTCSALSAKRPVGIDPSLAVVCTLTMLLRQDSPVAHHC